MNSRVAPILAAAILVVGGLVASEWALHMRFEAVIGGVIGAVLFVGLVCAVLTERLAPEHSRRARRRRKTRL